MHPRQNALNEWLKSIFLDAPYTITLLAGDASFRRYFRLHCNGTSYVLMDAPPEREAILPFINIGKSLRAHGIYTPYIQAIEYTAGFILLEDLGDQLLLTALSEKTANALYNSALSTLLQLQKCSTTDPKLPSFDTAFMLEELSIFRQWFLDSYLSIALNAIEEQLLQDTFHWLTTEIIKEPQVFIHRDYHSRNLIVIDSKNMGVIDFQDAMIGPCTYDAVSLLKDCYIQWPRERVLGWLQYFYDHLTIEHPWSFSEFTKAFDLCGLQRHLKVLGVFCRLHLRDKKTAYLQDLPLTFHYVTSCLESYPELKPFYDFMQGKVYSLFSKRVPS